MACNSSSILFTSYALSRDQLKIAHCRFQWVCMATLQLKFLSLLFPISSTWICVLMYSVMVQLGEVEVWTQTEVLDNECIPSKNMRQGFSLLLRESRTHLWTTSVTGFIKEWESTYSGSEDLWQRGFILEKVSQDLGQEAPARTQVYLSKTELRNTSYLYTKSTVEMMTS